jgi:spore germination protein GerM
MRPLTLLTALALALTACTDSTVSTTTTTLSTTAPPTATTAVPPETTTTTVVSLEDAATTFFFEDTGGNKARFGPFLVAVHDQAAGLEPRDALNALLDGPPSEAMAAGITTEIPVDTSLVSLDAGADGVATVELSQEFDDGGGSATMFGRLAQLTYTLTAFEGIESVLLMENGAVVEVFSSEGIVLDGPMVREDFQDLLPGILVESPAWGAPVTLPFEASGTAAAFEAVFQAEMLVDGNAVFDPPFVMSDNGMGFASFTFEVDADVAPPVEAVLRVWEFSAEDGSVVSERFVPITITAD